MRLTQGFLKYLVIDFSQSNRVYGLDILRAAAILFVVIGHGIKILPSGNFAREVSMYLDFDGVSIFFVLSGFLIGGILIKIIEKQEISLSSLLRFWIRRWMRTLPNYFFVLIMLIFILPLIFNGQIEDSLRAKFDYALFIQNFNTKHPYFFPEAWSLSIEEWFYLLIPIFIFLVIKVFKLKPNLSILIVSIMVLVFVTIFRYIRFLEFDSINSKVWDYYFRKQVLTRLDSLMFGIIGAYIAYYLNRLWKKYKLILFIIGLIFIWFERYSHIVLGTSDFGVYKCVFSFTIGAIGTFLTLPFLSNLKKGKGFIFKAITFISLISYSMYLINLSIVQGYFLNYFPSDLNENVYLRYMVFWILVIVGSFMMYKFVETPFMKLRDKLTR